MVAFMTRRTVDGVELGAEGLDAADAAVVPAHLAQEVDALPGGQDLPRLVHCEEARNLGVPVVSNVALF